MATTKKQANLGMMPKAISKYSASLVSRFGAQSLINSLGQSWAGSNVTISATDSASLIKELSGQSKKISQKFTLRQGLKFTKNTVEKQIPIMEKERNRLIPIASRKHWIALIFSIIFGLIFMGSVIVLITGTIPQAIVSFLASIIPGFLGKVFFSREKQVEDKIEKVSFDIRTSEGLREKIELLERILKIVPVKLRPEIIQKFANSLFPAPKKP